MNRYNGKEVENITVISIDINGLKFINDTLGHLEGDKIIVECAKIINDIMSKYGNISRIGGDEFVVILEYIEESQVEILLYNLATRVKQYNSLKQTAALSIAFGYSYHTNGIINMDYMFQIADNNMYQSKLLMKESIRGTFVKTFMIALKVKDNVSEGHTTRMEQLAVMVGEVLMLHQDQLDRLILLTKFHDIGKIGIPDSILKKPDKLTEDEWKVMKTHSAIGERIAMESAEIKEIAPLILHHHEKWDGSGYPSGLANKDIPIECRILSIVDSFDAMTNDRPYSKARGAAEAIKEIVACSGTHYDPKLVGIFCGIQKKL